MFLPLSLRAQSIGSDTSGVAEPRRPAVMAPDSVQLERAVVLQAAQPIPFEGYNPEISSLRWDHTAIVAGVLGVTITAVHIYQANAWWSNRRSSFHFVNDDSYALNVDKAGHLVAGSFNAFLGQKALQWSGVSRDASVNIGAAIGALFQTYVEFEDGFAADWGFSPGDEYANLIGAAWPIGQRYVPFMKHLQPKFSYWPSKIFREGRHHGNAIDDYEGQTYWVGVHVHGLLPDAWKSYWPDWLGIAVGVAVRNMESSDATQRNVILALDYDMTKIVPGDSWWLRTLKEAMNFLHYPSPAIRISPGFVSYGLYFQ